MNNVSRMLPFAVDDERTKRRTCIDHLSRETLFGKATRSGSRGQNATLCSTNWRPLLFEEPIAWSIYLICAGYYVIDVQHTNANIQLVPGETYASETYM